MLQFASMLLALLNLNSLSSHTDCQRRAYMTPLHVRFKLCAGHRRRCDATQLANSLTLS